MARKPLGTKDRLLRAGERLFRTQGYAGTGLKELTSIAAAPWGSMYHFFPGGKEQLAQEVIEYASGLYVVGWDKAFARFSDPAEAIEQVFLAEAALLEGSDFRDGCPIASVTLDVASLSEDLRDACAQGFQVWLRAIENGLRAAGAPQDRAQALAVFVLSSLEGAIVLSRADKSVGPLLQSAGFLRQVVARESNDWGRFPARST
jgi:AcrR family transcriptional regulator